MKPKSAAFVWMLLVCAGMSVSWAGEWPQWRGPHRDGKSAESGLLKSWPPEGPPLLWQYDGVGEGYASLCVTNDRIFTTGMQEDEQGVLSALDLEGKLLWQSTYGPEWTGTHAGARSCPTFNAGRLYLLSGTANLVCFNASDGSNVWSLDIAKEFGGTPPRMGWAESLLVVDDKVICTPGGADAGLVALDKATGTLRWRTQGLSDQNAYCSPIPVSRGDLRLILTITGSHLVGVDVENGEVIWQEPFDTEAVDPNHSVSPVYEDGRIYLTSGHREGGVMYTLAEDGRSVAQGWTDTILNTLHGGLVALDGYVYGSNTTGRWICLDLKTGQTLHEDRGVGMGSLISADGMLYCYGEKGTLALVKAVPEVYEMISSFKITPGKGPHWAHPAISNQRLYIRHGDLISAYDIAGKAR